MTTWQILIGDVREQLKTLPDQSVQCVVTSPPYWGLRDYGTAQWDGGDPACDHKKQSELGDGAEKWDASPTHERPFRTGSQYTHQKVSGGDCGKCGARRIDSQIGLERSPIEYVSALCDVFGEVWRVLRDDGCVWLNLGDSYNSGTTAPSKASALADVGGWTSRSGDAAGSRRIDWPGLKPKDLCGIPWRVAFALQAGGWYLRSDIIWSKPNPMPESVTDRPTKSHEYLFLLTKSERYFYDAEAIKEASEANDESRARAAYGGYDGGGAKPRGVGDGTPDFLSQSAGRFWPSHRNKRSVWHVATQPYPEAHFATYPEALIEPCILAGTSEKGQCPTCGAPWVRVVEDPDFSQQPKRQTSKDAHLRNGDRTSAGQAWQEWRNANPSKTIGWQPSCSCDAGEPVPQIVLDPFCGSGTTLAVAVRHLRSGIGIELNPSYVELARKRIGSVAPLLAREVA